MFQLTLAEAEQVRALLSQPVTPSRGSLANSLPGVFPWVAVN